MGLSLALLAGCGPTAQEQAAIDAAQRAADQQKCAGFGFAPGTEGFAHCMLSITQQRDAQAAEDRRADQARRDAQQRADKAAEEARQRASRAESDKFFGVNAPQSDASPPDMKCKTNSTTAAEGNTTTTTTNSYCHN